MTPLIVAGLGVAALGAGWLLLRSLGPRYRVGRLLAVAPKVSVDQALALALAPSPPYVRIDGRVDAEDEFEDVDHRPLVFRRTLVEVRRASRWDVVEDGREAVPFVVREGLSSIGVDETVLSDGLVVIRRESAGVAGDIPDRVPADLAAATPVRVSIMQLSSVDHVSALGVPAPDGTGRVRLTAGRGRPLIVTNLEPAEAMRTLASDHRYVPFVASIVLAGGVALLVAAGALALIGVR